MPLLQTVLLLVGIVLGVAATYAVYEAVITLRSVRRFSDGIQTRLLPLLAKFDVTVDALNAELLRIDGIVTQIEEVSDRVSSTTNAVQDAVHGPLEAVSNIGSKLRGVFKRSHSG